MRQQRHGSLQILDDATWQQQVRRVKFNSFFFACGAFWLTVKFILDLNLSSWANSNYKQVIACAAIANSGDEEWDFALERYLSTDLSSEKEMLLYALSCSTSPEALNTYAIHPAEYKTYIYRLNWNYFSLLEWGLDANSGIRRQDSRIVFTSVADNPLGSTMVFDFILLNWDKMVKA